MPVKCWNFSCIDSEQRPANFSFFVVVYPRSACEQRAYAILQFASLDWRDPVFSADSGERSRGSSLRWRGPARRIPAWTMSATLAYFARSRASVSCSPAFPQLALTCAPLRSAKVLAAPVFAPLRLQSPHFSFYKFFPCYEQNPGARPGLAKNSLHPVAKRALRTLPH